MVGGFLIEQADMLQLSEDDKYLGCVGKMFFSRILRPITTARLQVVAEKSGMYSWGDDKFSYLFYKLGGTRPRLGMQLICG